MTRTLIMLMTATFALLGLAADKSAIPKSVTYPKDGVWKPISAALGGSKAPQPALSAITLRISGANYEVSVFGEKQPDKGTHTLDETTTPKRITITSTNGPNKGKTFLGIYEAKDANSFRVCYDLSGGAFPTTFESSAKTGHYLVEYRRSDEKPPRPTDAEEDAKLQSGIWKPAGAILGGEKLMREELNKITLIIKDGGYETVVDGEPNADKGTVSLDTSVTPKRMTIQGIEGPNKGKTILAIYEMGQTGSGEDTFRVCYDLSGKAFPAEFNSQKGSPYYLVGYRRRLDAAPAADKSK